MRYLPPAVNALCLVGCMLMQAGQQGSANAGATVAAASIAPAEPAAAPAPATYNPSMAPAMTGSSQLPLPRDKFTELPDGTIKMTHAGTCFPALRRCVPASLRSRTLCAVARHRPTLHCSPAIVQGFLMDAVLRLMLMHACRAAVRQSCGICKRLGP